MEQAWGAIAAQLPGVRALVDIVIVVTLLEALVLAAYHARTGRGLAPRDFVPSLAAGLGLMIAVRAALGDAGWAWVAAGLMLSGLAHALDVRRRWAGPRPGG